MSATPKDWAEAHIKGEDIREAADLAWQESKPHHSQRRPNGARAEPQSEPDDTGDVRAWPMLPPAAMRGLAGEFAHIATEHSEADPVAVMTTTLTAIGALMGRSRYMVVDNTEHHARLDCALVGATGRARKGTSWSPVRRLVKRTEDLIAPARPRLQITHGPLSTGEGLIAAIRDSMGPDDTGGTDDKRLLVVEGEFGAALRAMQRQGNTLSMIMRTAWDGHQLAPLIKTDRMIASDPHICIVAHITRHELNSLLNAADVWGGLANRFLWACVRRRAIVPFPKSLSDADLDSLAKSLAEVVTHVHEHPAEMRMSNSAQALWAVVYRELTLAPDVGLCGAATARAEAQTLRLALTFALIDGADRIEDHHLEAGLAMWRYANDSADYLFGAGKIDPAAQTILTALSQGPKTQSQIRDLFNRHKSAAELGRVLGDLQERGRVTLTKEETGGAPRKVWSKVL